MPDGEVIYLENIKPFSLGKVLAFFGAFYGLLLGIFIFFGFHTSILNWLPGLTNYGELSFVVLPVLYGTGGFLAGTIIAILYNIMADLGGGIEIETDED